MRRVSILLAGLFVLWQGSCTLDVFMFNGSPQDGPYDFSNDIVPASAYDPEGTFVTAADGTRIHLHFVQSSGLVPGRSDITVFYCHGNKDNIGHYWDRVELFYEMGVQTLIFDYRGYGRSEGESTEEGLYQDAEAAWAHLQTLPEFNPDRVVFYGYSLGGAVCTEMAYRHTAPPQLLILEATYKSVEALVEDGATGSVDVSMVTDLRFDNYAKIPHIDMPLFVMHGSEDDFLQPQYGRDLYDAAQEPKEFWLVPGANHGTVPDGSRRQPYLDRVTAFIDLHLP